MPTGLKAFVAPVLAASLTGCHRPVAPAGAERLPGLNYAQAKQQFQSQKHIRVLFEEGAAKGQPSGAPLPRFEHSFTRGRRRQRQAGCASS